MVFVIQVLLVLRRHEISCRPDHVNTNRGIGSWYSPFPHKVEHTPTVGILNYHFFTDRCHSLCQLSWTSLVLLMFNLAYVARQFFSYKETRISAKLLSMKYARSNAGPYISLPWI